MLGHCIQSRPDVLAVCGPFTAMEDGDGLLAVAPNAASEM